MVNKGNTVTVAELLAILADGRITPDMPIAIWDNATGTIRGVNAFEIQTFKDGSKALTFFDGAVCAEVKNVETTAEVFP